jgi:hypothetical protein
MSSSESAVDPSMVGAKVALLAGFVVVTSLVGAGDSMIPLSEKLVISLIPKIPAET